MQLRRGIGYVIQQVGLFPHQTIGTNVAHRADAARHAAGADPGPVARAARPGRAGPGRLRRPLPAPALRRSAAARRRGAGAGRRPAGAAHGRAVRRGRPGGARPGCRTSSSGSSATLGKTVVLVTHDIDEAVRLGDRVAVFATGGRLAQVGTPAELLARPADDFVADFVGATKGLRRLAVTPIDPAPPRAARRRHAPATSPAPSTSTSTLEQALAALLRDDRQVVGVRQGAQFLGVLTPNGIHRALRESLRDRR